MAELIQVGEFATEGERVAAETLRADLPSDWVIITNTLLPRRDGRTFEIDLLLLAQRHLFVLDEKAWGGTITGDTHMWQCADGRIEHNPLNKVEMVAKHVAGHARASLPPSLPDIHFVLGLLLFSNPHAYLRINDPHRNSRIVRLADAADALLEQDAQGGVDLRPHRHTLRRIFAGFAPRPRLPQTIHAYQVDEVEPSREGVLRLAAKLQNQRYRLMVYDLGADPLLREQRRTLYDREFEALRALQETGLVAHAEVPIIWGEAQLVVPVRLPDGQPLGAIPFPTDRATLLDDLRFAEAAFRGLQQIHACQVLHRALSPAALFKSPTGRPLFTDFHAARISDQSIAPSLDLLKSVDPYAAPLLVAGYGNATPATDCFSLGMIFLERLSAIQGAQLQLGQQIEWPNLLRRWASLPLAPLERLQALFQQLLQPAAGAAPLSAEQVANELTQVIRLLQQEPTQEQIFDQRYRVVRQLGQGAMARTFLVTDIAHPDLGVFAVKQFRNPELALEQSRTEFQTLQKLRSRHVPRIYEISKPTDDIHLKMEYIPGQTLLELEARFPLPLHTWWEYARQLLDLLAELERHQLLHRDIKPANLILHEEEDRLVLIDFGFAMPRAHQGAAAGSLIYQPPEAQTSPIPPGDSDRYAAAVLLFRMLTGELPFEEADRQRPRTPSQFTQFELPRQRLAEVLLDALHPQPDQRPPTLALWRQQLERARLALSEAAGDQHHFQINGWVASVRGLYRNSQGGNADNRGLDSQFVRQTYVPTRLDTTLLPLLLAQRPRAIFLCGNPGDGKTAFLEQVREQLRAQGGREEQYDASGWEILLNGHTYRSCYDASEAHAGRSANEQLTARLASLEGAREPGVPLTVLVAINDGRLLDYLDQVRATFPWLTDQLRAAMRPGQSITGKVWYVDLKQRAFVTLPNGAHPSTFQQVLAKLVAPDQWSVCASCAAQQVCPLYQNATRLRDAQVSQRLERIMLLVHLRRQRHITMRDLRSTLAYIITGNRSCEDIHAAVQSADGGASLIANSYWQLLFAPQEQADELLLDLRSLDPAQVSLPHLDRFLHAQQRAEHHLRRRQLFQPTFADDLPPQRFIDLADWLAAMKRRLYFESQETLVPGLSWTQLLPYRYAETFIELLAQRRPLSELKPRLANGIWRSDRVTIDMLPDRFNLVINHSAAQRMVVAKEFALDDFLLNRQHLQGTEAIEAIPEGLLLEHRSGTPKLSITLDLFELLLRLDDGLLADTPELRPLLEDLVPFKSALLLDQARSLLLIESGRYRHRLEQQQGRLRLRTDGEQRQ